MTRYAESDELLARSLSAAAAQQGIVGEILFVDQRVDNPFDENLVEQGNIPLRVIFDACGSLSAARNIALQEARFDHILYLDADALPQPDWAQKMSHALDQEEVAIVGGRIMPGWEHTPPFFTRANVVLDQYSMLDLGDKDGEATKIVGASFGVDRAKIPSHIQFDPVLGRRDGRLFGGEESAFFNEVRATGLGARYVGTTYVTHLVARERLRLGWILERMFYAGYGRSSQGGAPAPSRRPNAMDWVVAPIMLPPYVLGWLWRKLSR
ncbi:glycosyltransferase family A protein [uncultured Erythrobacter sp.]|uniref:glycosyltransferase family A protein n=1 Tax=uncultured Erythrobacter sp. TaxID=263913 RepID=UPI002634F789|nr:glycosyltransferase family A protein [uncultured Erythrobacter sp.]